LRPVAGRGNAIGAQANPGEERDQRQVVTGTGRERIERLTDDELAQALVEVHFAALRARRRANTAISFSAWRSPLRCAASMPCVQASSACAASSASASARPRSFHAAE